MQSGIVGEAKRCFLENCVAVSFVVSGLLVKLNQQILAESSGRCFSRCFCCLLAGQSSLWRRVVNDDAIYPVVYLIVSQFSEAEVRHRQGLEKRLPTCCVYLVRAYQKLLCSRRQERS